MNLTTRDLGMRYPAQASWAVNGITVEIRSGQVTWLTGALGSGTSTLLLALAGLAPRLTGGERTGSVTADGLDVSTLTPLVTGIAYLGPSPALQLSGIAKTVRDEVAVGPMNLGKPREQIGAASAHALKRLGISHLADRAPGTLSDGETQRVLLAALLCSGPRIWLLDEPFSALDRASTLQVRQLLHELAGEGAVVVIACDDADTMLGIAGRLLVMRRGTIVLDGNPREILAGDAVLASGAGTTDAGMLAHAAGLSAPRPITRDELLAG